MSTFNTIERNRSSNNTVPGVATHRKRKCCDVHCNNLWSLWYGITVVLLEAFVVYKCVSRFLLYLALPWPERKQPYLELNLFVGLVGAGVVLLPFYFISFMFKIGNLANDGYKLGFQLSACAMDPPSVLAQSSGFIRNAWHHGGPTAPFIHLVSAFCFIIPKVFMEAKLIEVGFLANENIWKTDLDWMIPNQNRMIILNFLTNGAINTTNTTPAPFHHPAAQIREYLEAEDTWFPFSPEFINYGLALLVYSVRYPAVFWNTNKGFSFLFSLQLLANSFQNLLALGGISIMYKVQMLGPQNVLHKYEPFLLNTPICMLLYGLSCIIVTASSCVLYMYGYQKFMAFISLERDKNNIVLREGRTSLWSYFSHCAAMCVLIALAVCNGPLLYDFTLIYKGSLDGTVLACVIGTILHLFLWIVLWLFLTVKQQWSFKLRVTVGRHMVRNARSIKMVNDIDLADRDSEAMLIMANGRTFSVTDSAPKKLIMNTLARAAIERDRALDEPSEDERMLIQSPNMATLARQKKPARIVTVQNSPQGSCGSSVNQRPKVTFHEQQQDELAASSAANSPRPSHAVSDICSPRMVRREDPQMEHDDCDDLPPPPGHPDEGLGQGCQSQRLLVSPRPIKNPVHDIQQELHTPRSNRSVDSGLPHDDITPRSDSLSTASSTSPPDQHQLQRELQQQHRKSTSMDDININGGGIRGLNPPHPNPGNNWKSYSLQRGTTAPNNSDIPKIIPNPGNPIYASTNSEGTMVIRRPSSAKGTTVITTNVIQDDEDPYGRCTNMKLTSFADNNKDPRIIDLTLGASPTNSQNGLNMAPERPYPNNFNTLPAQVNGGSSGSQGKPPMGPNGTRNSPLGNNNVTNTLPARVTNGHNGPTAAQITGRHFKPFDHRKMNPMAGIQEDPYNNPDGHSQGTSEPIYSSQTTGNLIVQKNTHLPHLPNEVRHTNYSQQQGQQQQRKPTLVNPQVMEHRDSANFSLTSSDSG